MRVKQYDVDQFRSGILKRLGETKLLLKSQIKFKCTWGFQKPYYRRWYKQDIQIQITWLLYLSILKYKWEQYLITLVRIGCTEVALYYLEIQLNNVVFMEKNLKRTRIPCKGSGSTLINKGML